MNTGNTTDSGTILRTFGLTFSLPTLLPPASPHWHQFAIAIRTPLSIRAEGASWLIPPGAGFWIPADMGCEVRNPGTLTLRMIYVPTWITTDTGKVPNQCRALAVSPLLRELIERVVLIGALVQREPRHRRLFDILCDELADAKSFEASLREPTSPEALKLIEQMEQEHFAIDSLPLAIKESGFSRRTMERIFLRETNLSMGRWLRRRRSILAAELLSANQSASSVALKLGYSSPSAFSEMVQRELGMLPSELAGRVNSANRG